MQKEKIAAIALGLIIIGILSAYIIANNWEEISKNLFPEDEEFVFRAVDDTFSININSINTPVKILLNDKYDKNETISIEIVKDTSYGELDVNGTSVKYTPNADFLGKDSFTYNLMDEKGTTSQATVSIEVTYGVIEAGDSVDVYYIGKFSNGTVFDTNIEEVAKNWDLYDENRTYELAKVFVDPNLEFIPPDGYEDYSSQYIKGFLQGLIGMVEGEIKDVTIDPENAYGIWNKTLAEELFSFYFQTPYWPRKVTNFLSEEIEKIRLVDYNASINITEIYEGYTFDYIEAENQEGEPVYWKIQVTNISGENITIKNVFENNTVLKSEGMWDNVIVIENDTHFSIKGEPEFNKVYGSAGFFMRLEEINETAIIVSINVESPDAKFIGETLVFQLEAVKVYKTSLELES